MTKSNTKNLGRLTKAELIELLKEKEKAYNSNGLRPVDIYNEVKDYANKDKEHFLCVTLDGSHSIITTHLVTIGLVNRTLVHPREVFRPAILDNATAVAIIHNHPSGNLEPSADDMEVTLRIKKAGNLLGITLVDHIIIGKTGYRSMMESGEMF